MYAPEFGSKGRLSMGVFQKLLAGKISHPDKFSDIAFVGGQKRISQSTITNLTHIKKSPFHVYSPLELVLAL
jgi:hypothetical protein